MRSIGTYSSGKQSTNNHPQTTSEKNSSSSTALGPLLPRSLPPSLTADDSSAGYVLSHERLVSKPVTFSALGWRKEQIHELLTCYVRGTVIAFTRTPQAYLLRKMVPAAVGETFDATYISDLSFSEIGVRVDGVYTLAYRGVGPAAAVGVSGRS